MGAIIGAEECNPLAWFSWAVLWGVFALIWDGSLCLNLLNVLWTLALLTLDKLGVNRVEEKSAAVQSCLSYLATSGGQALEQPASLGLHSHALAASGMDWHVSCLFLLLGLGQAHSWSVHCPALSCWEPSPNHPERHFWAFLTHKTPCLLSTLVDQGAILRGSVLWYWGKIQMWMETWGECNFLEDVFWSCAGFGCWQSKMWLLFFPLLWHKANSAG